MSAWPGLSDPVPKVRTLDARAAEIEAVMDAAGFGRAALLGVSEGGPAAILFAATRRERTRALILTGTTSYNFAHGWDDLELPHPSLVEQEDASERAELLHKGAEFGHGPIQLDVAGE